MAGFRLLRKGSHEGKPAVYERCYHVMPTGRKRWDSVMVFNTREERDSFMHYELKDDWTVEI